MNAEQEKLITDNLSIIARVVAREMSLGIPPWVDRSDLEDVGNLAIVRAAIEFTGNGSFPAFAYTVIHHAVVDEIKQARYRFANRGEMPDSEAHVGVVTGNDIDMSRAMTTLQGMYPRQYRAVMLTYWGGQRDPINGNPAGMCAAEVGEEMGTTVDAVENLLRRAKQNISSVLRRNRDSQSPIYMKGISGK